MHVCGCAVLHLRINSCSDICAHACVFMHVYLVGSSRVNLVPLSSVVASPRDTVLAVVICIALTSVLLALMLFCAIYCKRQLEKKPHGNPA